MTMANIFNAVSSPDTLTMALSQAWTRLGERRFAPLARWQLTHLDRDGQRQNVAVDVLEVMPQQGLILVRGGPQDEPLVIQLARIIEAIDTTTDSKVMPDRWLAHVDRSLQAGLNRPEHWVH
jgi:hypothetical protein